MGRMKKLALILGSVLFLSACTGGGGGSSAPAPATRAGGLPPLPAPRGAPVGPWQSIQGEYVALGDSFSSGEGAPRFVEGTDTCGVKGNSSINCTPSPHASGFIQVPWNECHRSTQAYPVLVSREVGAPFFEDRACSGAVTANFAHSQKWSDMAFADPQEFSLEVCSGVPGCTARSLITLTMGGDDVGFSTIGEACISATATFKNAEQNKKYSEANCADLINNAPV
jgi:hypothetical protein